VFWRSRHRVGAGAGRGRAVSGGQRAGAGGQGACRLPQRRGALLLDGSGQRPAGGRERRGGRVYVLAMTPLCWIISRFPCIPSTDLRVYMLPPADQLVIANLVLRFPAAVHRSVFFSIYLDGALADNLILLLHY
jgi:hypothetical protein